MLNKPSALNKFHLINAVYNAATEPPANYAGEDARRTGNEIVQWAYNFWDSPDSKVSKRDVDDMFLHLLKTGQVVFLCGRPFNPAEETNYMSLFVTLGKVLFEKDLEGQDVSPEAERLARSILSNLDGRRNSPTKNWDDDVREEAVNTWAAIFDEVKSDSNSTSES
jgi:hypothetical protein